MQKRRENKRDFRKHDVKRYIVRVFILISISTISNAQLKITEEILAWSDAEIERNPIKTMDSLAQYLSKIEGVKNAYDAGLVLNKIIYHSYFKLSNIEEALRHIEKLNTLSEENKDERLEILYHENKGMLYFESGLDRALAFHHFKKAYELAKKNKANFRMEYIANNYALVLMGDDNYETAEKILLHAINLSNTKNNLQQSATIYANTGILYLIQDNFEMAEYHFKKAVEKALESKNLGVISSRASYLGAFYLDINQHDSTEKYLTLAEHHIHDLRLNQDKAFIYRKQLKLHELYDDKDKMIWYFKKLTLQNDSVRQNQLDQVLNEFDYKLSIKKMEDAKAIEVNKLEQDKRSRNLIIVIIALSSLSLTISMFYVINKLKNNAKIAKLNEQKNNIEKEKNRLDKEILDREIVAKSLFILEKENLTTKITHELNTLKTDFDESKINQSIQNIISEIKTSSNSSAHQEFELRFKDVHPHFYKNLAEKHPDLTPNEKKLAAFLVMGLNTKDISSITGQSTNTIKIARTRLRKKLNLTQTPIKLSTYLLSFV